MDRKLHPQGMAPSARNWFFSLAPKLQIPVQANSTLSSSAFELESVFDIVISCGNSGVAAIADVALLCRLPIAPHNEPGLLQNLTTGPHAGLTN